MRVDLGVSADLAAVDADRDGSQGHIDSCDEAGALSQSLTYGLQGADFEVICLEAQQVKNTLDAIAQQDRPQRPVTALTFKSAVDDPARFVAQCRGPLRIDTQTLPVRRDGQPWSHLASWRCRCVLGALCGGASAA